MRRGLPSECGVMCFVNSSYNSRFGMLDNFRASEIFRDIRVKVTI